MTKSATCEKPIIFSAPSILAIQEGRKKMIRRAVNPQPDPRARGEETVLHGPNWHFFNRPNRNGKHNGGMVVGTVKCPYAVGNRLWVRETWQDYCPLWGGVWCGHGDQEGVIRDHLLVYRADPLELHLRGSEGNQASPVKWRSPIHMPRWASRLTLEITEVRVERLQSISEEDAITEGVDSISIADVPRQATLSRRADFAQLWDKVNGKHPWESNPWVWTISFRVVP